MNGLTAVRNELTEQLEAAGFKVMGHVPSQITPPLIIIGAGDPYVEETDTGYSRSQMVVNLEVWLIAGQATNAKQTQTLDSMIEEVVLNLGEWTLAGVSAPSQYQVNQSLYLACQMAVSNQFNLNEG